MIEREREREFCLRVTKGVTISMCVNNTGTFVIVIATVFSSYCLFT